MAFDKFGSMTTPRAIPPRRIHLNYHPTNNHKLYSRHHQPPLLPTPATDTTTTPRPRREQHQISRLRLRSRKLFSYFSRNNPPKQPLLPSPSIAEAPSKRQTQMTQLRLQHATTPTIQKALKARPSSGKTDPPSLPCLRKDADATNNTTNIYRASQHGPLFVGGTRAYTERVPVD